MKRIVWCVAVMMLLVCVGTLVLAEEQTRRWGEDGTYILLEDGSVRITRGGTRMNGPSEEVIPGELDGCPVVSLGTSAYAACRAMERVVIPDGVTHIEGNPFTSCAALRTIEVSPDHPTLALIDGVLFDKTEKRLLCYPAGLEADSYEIPQGITAIADGAFASCGNLERVVIPDSVTSIGARAFEDCESLAQINLPDSVTAIGQGAFGNCSSLTGVEIPPEITAIPDDVFNGCYELASVTLPDGLTDIGVCAFSRCGLTELVLPAGVTSIGESAFSECVYLESLTIPEGVTAIGDYAFCECGGAGKPDPARKRGLHRGKRLCHLHRPCAADHPRGRGVHRKRGLCKVQKPCGSDAAGKRFLHRGERL